MIERLGNVLYWLGCAIGVIFGALCCFGVFFGVGSERWITIIGAAIFAAVFWATGRACRYVLAGR